jgi:hypothetical protein
MKKSYSDLLKDPKWQKKRLEIFQRDNFICQKCNDNGDTLHVHHKKYLKNTDPWDYPDELLITLCGLCHTFAEDKKQDFDLLQIISYRDEENILKIFKYPGKKIMIAGDSNSNYFPLFLDKESVNNLVKFLND